MIMDVIGILSGLLAMFTFLTGATSARELLRRARGWPAAQPTSRRRLWLVLGLSTPVFVLSMVVTLRAGLNGSDTGGAQFVMLLIGAVLLVLYATRWSASMRWTAFLVTCLVTLGGLGLLMGNISTGEEAEGISAGLVIGLAIGLLALAFRHGPAGTVRKPGATGAPGGTVAPGAARTPDAGPARQAVSALIADPASDPSRPGHADREREILALVQQRGGEVTAFEVGLHTSLSLHEAREILDQLTAGGFCQRRVAPDGATIYRFPDVRPVPEARSAGRQPDGRQPDGRQPDGRQPDGRQPDGLTRR